MFRNHLKHIVGMSLLDILLHIYHHIINEYQPFYVKVRKCVQLRLIAISGISIHQCVLKTFMLIDAICVFFPNRTSK